MKHGTLTNITFHINVKCHDYGLTTATSLPCSWPTKLSCACWKMEFGQRIMLKPCDFKTSRLVCCEKPEALSKCYRRRQCSACTAGITYPSVGYTAPHKHSLLTREKYQ